MQLTLSNEDAQTLRNVLSDHLPNLRREAAATDLASRELRNELNKRVDLCERLVADLSGTAGSTSGQVR